MSKKQNLKVKIFPVNLGSIAVSGIGKAIKHQKYALGENDVDVVEGDDFEIGHTNTYSFPSLHFMNWCRRKKRPLIVHAHSTEEDFRNSFIGSNLAAPFYKIWLKHLYNKADLLLTPTPYSKCLLESYGLKPEIKAISNGIDISKFEYSDEKRLAFCMDYGFKADDKLVVSVGLFFRRKGIFDFVELAKKMPEYQFVWCGYLDPRLIQSDTQKLLKTELPNLHFVGYITDMVAAYSAADLFFMPSYEETEGIVVLEALSMRVPTLVRNIGVYDGWLFGGENCYMGSNNEEFERLIREILEHGADKDIVEKGYQVAAERDLVAIGKRLKEIYLELLEQKKSS